MTNFESFGLQNEILRAIEEMGFIEPTPVQQKSIPEIIDAKNDIIVLAQTGTGKTAAFGLPILHHTETQTKSIQTLILCPTRELCMQITKDFQQFSTYLKDVSVTPVYGGANISTQISALKKGSNIVVGTPGRTLDLIKRKILKINKIKYLVLDEADEMLNMGFRDDLDAILETTPVDRQTMLFSATMPKGVRHIAENYMNSPKEISLGKKNIGAENVNHQYYMVKASNRYEAVKRIIDVNPNIYAIVFCRTRQETKDIADKLMQEGYNADALHGDLSQAQRDYVMQRFRSKRLQLLIATDVAARGVDVESLTHVINYNMPDDPEVYIHRSGRTGRAGKSGTSIMIIHGREKGKIKDLERKVNKKFEHCDVPEGKEICENQLYNLIEKIENIEIDENQIKPFLPYINSKLEHIEFDELIKRIVSVEFNRFLNYYKDAQDINIPLHESHSKSSSGSRRKKAQYTRFYINLGAKHNVKEPQIIGLINEVTKTRDIDIGKIDVLKNFSFFETDSVYDDIIINCFKGAKYQKERLRVEVSTPIGTKKNNKRKPRKKRF